MKQVLLYGMCFNPVSYTEILFFTQLFQDSVQFRNCYTSLSYKQDKQLTGEEM